MNKLGIRLMLLAGAFILFVPHMSIARPFAPKLFCTTYPDSALCQGHPVSCHLCHSAPPTLNNFGIGVASNLDGEFSSALPTALKGLEIADTDGDGINNLEEWLLGTHPGDAAHYPILETKKAEWNASFAYQRMKNAFCGISPTYEEMKTLQAAQTPKDVLHEELDVCLKSEYWRMEVLHRLADPKIKPLRFANNQFANYDWDYNLFEYALTDGHDARLLLTADFHVERDDDGVLHVREGIIPPPATGTDNYGSPPSVGGQPLEPQYRAGMITTQWFLWYNTMGQAIPRVTAAQAYRAYLGAEIAAYKGLYENQSTITDYDQKGVTDSECLHCHLTLDPLSYAFSHYWGAFGGAESTGSYYRLRPSLLLPADSRGKWYTEPPQSKILGAEVSDLVNWAQVAANSDAFKIMVTKMLFTHATGREPEAGDQTDFNTLWQALPDHDYQMDALAHLLVDTNAFGAP